MRARNDLLAVIAVGVIATAIATSACAQGAIERVSVGPGGRQANSNSFRPSLSADGRFVAFDSFASNLVSGDTNSVTDVFVRDRLASVTRQVSVGLGGAQANNESPSASISADGRFVAFVSDANNLVPGDSNDWRDVFVRDRRLGVTRRVSVGPGGAQADSISFEASISADGRFVAFSSEASNLVPRDTNGVSDIFIRDRQRAVTRRVSVGPGGRQASSFSIEPAISADGRFVAFESDANNLVPGDTNGADDVFVRDRRMGVTRRVSVGSGGTQANSFSREASISADGRFVAFTSLASNLVPGDTNGATDVFVRDLRAGVTWRVSIGPGGGQADHASTFPSISADGRFVAFLSLAGNLVPGDTNGATDVFVRDLRTRITRRVSGREGVGEDFVGVPLVVISAAGRFVAFHSVASNLVPGDTNDAVDVFVRDRRAVAAAAIE